MVSNDPLCTIPGAVTDAPEARLLGPLAAPEASHSRFVQAERGNEADCRRDSHNHVGNDMYDMLKRKIATSVLAEPLPK